MNRLAIAAIALACSSEPPRTDVPLALADLRAQLASPDRSRDIERIKVVPDDRGAEYIVTWMSRGRRSVARAEFPGPLVDEIYRARIPYSVKRTDDAPSGREKELDATTFKQMLERPEEAAEIEQIKIEPRGLGAARYALRVRTSGVPSAVYAEYPGAIVKAIEAARIPFVVAAR